MHPLALNFTAILQNWPTAAQNHFRELRSIVHDAARSADVDLLETTKWNEPAWLPSKPRIGSTLRSCWHPRHADALGLFLNCNSTLPETMRTLYPDTFTFKGKRSIWLPLDAPLPEDALHHCATLTLTYHRSKA
ncbi:DUF1801 domain-containing protein [Ascidiaceihabitans sp.]|uniref:DUF1801 domain-containing protein n=1 Tax=Ascidiaceihabitans sp. TaxID=1872644 RepID=UPI003296FA70